MIREREAALPPVETSAEDRAWSAFVAQMRDELYTPMSALVDYSDLLLEEARARPGAAVTPDLEKIQAAGRQLLALVEELLDPAQFAARSQREDLQSLGSHLRHELRTPLNAIIGYSEMILEEAPAEWLAADLEKVDRLGRQLLTMIEDLVRFSHDRSEGARVLDQNAASTLAREAVATLHPQKADPTPESRRECGRLLVVDDNEINRDLLARRLRREGHSVEVAENGRAALARLDVEPYDLVLLDIMMPEMNGYQVLETLKRKDRLRDLPVIMISALDEIESVIRCIEMGAEDYLPKPFNAILLRARIGACLEKKRLREAQIAMIKAEEERLKHELAMAARVQHQLFPECAPRVRGLDLAAVCHPAREVGGDYYDFLPLDESCLGIAIADVAGKGMSAALLMSAVRASLRGLLPFRGMTAAEMVGTLNELLLSWAEVGRYTTFFYLEYDPVTPRFTCVNAGHNPPLFRSSATGTVRPLSSGGLFLGGFPAQTYDHESFGVVPGDLLVAYTDGVTEALNPEGEEYGEERLKAALEAGRHLSAEALREWIVADVRAFCGEAPQYDDLTLVVVKVD